MIGKIIGWLGVNLASILGIVQAVIKLLKEVLTAIVNILFPIIPSAKFQKVVMAIRNWVNMIDDWVEKLKGYFLPKPV